jgi:hypothetical protein
VLSPNDYELKLRYAEMLVNELMESNTPDDVRSVVLPSLERAKREILLAIQQNRRHYAEMWQRNSETDD